MENVTAATKTTMIKSSKRPLPPSGDTPNHRSMKSMMQLRQIDRLNLGFSSVSLLGHSVNKGAG
jgi:hypothetical protein